MAQQHSLLPRPPGERVGVRGGIQKLQGAFSIRVRVNLLWLLLGLSAASPSQLPAQTNRPAAPAATSSSRFLFIVDTSAAMERHAPEILKVVSDPHYLRRQRPNPLRRHGRPLDLQPGRPFRPPGPSLVRRRASGHRPSHHGLPPATIRQQTSAAQSIGRFSKRRTNSQTAARTTQPSG